MSAEEFIFWDEHFSYFPFTFDRDDQRTAMLISVLTFMEGRQLKQPLKESRFIPDYLGTRTRSHEPTLEEQQRDFAAFHSKLKAIQPKKQNES